MADYTTADKVAVLLGYDSFSATTRPTSTQVATIISDVTKEIDFVLNSVGITTQPTDTNVLARLDRVCKYGVAGDIGMSTSGNFAGVDGTQGNKYMEMYQNALTEIKEHPEYYGAVTGDAIGYISNIVSDGNLDEDDLDDLFVDIDYRH